MTRVPFTTTWIEQGKILAGSIPQLPADIDVLHTMGIRDILTLSRRNPATYPQMRDRLLSHNMVWAHAPIPDVGIADDELMLDAAGFIDFSYDNHSPIYVHCRGGIGRTGMILLAYYVLHRGLSLIQAKEIVKVRRNWEGNASAIDQGSPQREWIEALEGKRHG